MQARARKVNLRVSSISPGIVETEFYQASRAGDAEGAQKFYSQANYLQARRSAALQLMSLSILSFILIMRFGNYFSTA